jgi:hypothetical protein
MKTFHRRHSPPPLFVLFYFSSFRFLGPQRVRLKKARTHVVFKHARRTELKHLLFVCFNLQLPQTADANRRVEMRCALASFAGFTFVSAGLNFWTIQFESQNVPHGLGHVGTVVSSVVSVKTFLLAAAFTLDLTGSLPLQTLLVDDLLVLFCGTEISVASLIALIRHERRKKLHEAQQRNDFL